jgi:hypothetical protein
MLKYMNLLSPVLLLAYVIRLLALGASMGDAIALVGLAGLYAFYLYLENNKEVPVNETVHKELLQNREDMKEMKQTIQALKLGTAFKR